MKKETKTKEKPLKVIIKPNPDISKEEAEANLFKVFDFLLSSDDKKRERKKINL